MEIIYLKSFNVRTEAEIERTIEARVCSNRMILMAHFKMKDIIDTVKEFAKTVANQHEDIVELSLPLQHLDGSTYTFKLVNYRGDFYKGEKYSHINVIRGGCFVPGEQQEAFWDNRSIRYDLLLARIADAMNEVYIRTLYWQSNHTIL